MKNTQVPLLLSVTISVLMFTIGLFIGRNHSGPEISLSFPEEMTKAPIVAAAQQSTPSGFSDTPVSPVDINTASYEDLLTLPGIGEGLALEILSYRAASGGFSHVEELLNVPGIGESRLESLLQFITVGGTP